MNPESPAKQRSRGQVMVLGVVTLLILAFMLMLSLNLTNTIHEKIRLQSHSDSMAYSMAVVEARAFNYFAYTNRASAAAFVSMASVHAWQASISAIPNMLFAAQINMYIIAVEEFAQCVSCCPFCCVQHCVHGIQAIRIAGKYSREARDQADKIKGTESHFNLAIQSLSFMVNTIHAEQEAVVLQTSKFLTGSGFNKLTEDNMPLVKAGKESMSLPVTVGALNVEEFACGMEGSVLDIGCILGPSKETQVNRATVMASVANAARPIFDRETFQIGLYWTLFPTWWAPKFMDIQGNGFGAPLALGNGEAGVSQGSTCTMSGNKNGSVICSKQPWGLMFNQYQDGVSVMPFAGSKIGSSKSGGYHNTNGFGLSKSSHQGQHDKFNGIQNGDSGLNCILSNNCFINFRASTDDGDEYNQPKVYAAFTHDLRLQRTGDKGPWELNQNGKVSIGDGERGSGALDLVPRRDGRAISKALVYFHRFDQTNGWKHAPNMFDPYWRAKLHPFKRLDALAIMGLTSDPDTLMGTVGPVEGQGIP